MLAPAFELGAMPQLDASVRRTANCGRRDSLANALGDGSTKRLAAKEHLFLEGDAKTHVYKVEAGTVLIYKILPDGKRQIIDIAFPGDLIGLGLTGEHAFHAQAAGPTRVRCLSVSALHHLATEDAELALKLYEAVAQELDAARHHLLTIGYRDATGRLASFLLALARRHERGGRDATELVMPMRRADIGDFLGLTIETVSRTFTKFKTDRLIDLDQGGYVRIRDRAGLERIAQVGPGHA